MVTANHLERIDSPLHLSPLFVMNDETMNALRAEIDMMLNTLALIRKLNSEGKTLKIDLEIEKILKSYHRN
jgi:hypothetical protein